MLIDWFTVGAQALNFIILVWLMKRFLYQPILTAIDAREAKLAAERADADAKKAEAHKERDSFQQKNAAFDAQRQAHLLEMTDAVHAERQRLLDEARQAADLLASKRRTALADEANALHQSISLRVQQEVFAIARKALADLAGVGLEERLSAAFTARLGSLDAPAHAQLAAALASTSEPAVVRSAIALTEADRATIRNALNETFSADVPVRFDTAPDLISGISLTVNGQKLAWSIADYLAALEAGVAELLKPSPVAADTNSSADTMPQASAPAGQSA
jgi:F-type H+-transporting ATPase subunit b